MGQEDTSTSPMPRLGVCAVWESREGACSAPYPLSAAPLPLTVYIPVNLFKRWKILPASRITSSLVLTAAFCCCNLAVALFARHSFEMCQWHCSTLESWELGYPRLGGFSPGHELSPAEPSSPGDWQHGTCAVLLSLGVILDLLLSHRCSMAFSAPLWVINCEKKRFSFLQATPLPASWHQLLIKTGLW